LLRRLQRYARGADGPEDTDGPEHSALVDPDPLQSDQLEQGEERQDHAGLALARWKEVLELEGLALRDPAEDLLDALLDRLAVLGPRVGEQGPTPLEQVFEGADEVEESRLEHLFARVVEAGQRIVGTRPGGGPDLPLLVENARG